MGFDLEDLILPGLAVLGGILFYFFVWKKETEFKPVTEAPPLNNDGPIEKSIFYSTFVNNNRYNNGRACQT